MWFGSNWYQVCFQWNFSIKLSCLWFAVAAVLLLIINVSYVNWKWVGIGFWEDLYLKYCIVSGLIRARRDCLHGEGDWSRFELASPFVNLRLFVICHLLFIRLFVIYYLLDYLFSSKQEKSNLRHGISRRKLHSWKTDRQRRIWICLFREEDLRRKSRSSEARLESQSLRSSEGQFVELALVCLVKRFF